MASRVERKKIEQELNEEFKEIEKDLNVKKDIVLEVKHLKMYFKINTGLFSSKNLKAVDDVSFFVKRGETLGLVGESGCGKTTLGRTILQLYKPTSGKIVFNGQRVNPPTKLDFEEVSAKRDQAIKDGDTERANKLTHTLDKMKASKKHYKLLLKDFRRKAQMVFQDPYSSLDPRMTVEDIIAEPLDVYHIYKTKEERHNRVIELMTAVGLSAEHATRYAHEFSGGQRQRIGIARSLALNPEFIVCDEPVSALDVSIQAQVINAFKELQKKLNLTYVFVAHNLLIVKHISDRIAVMYLGHIVEMADSDTLFDDPLHPYTTALLSAIPVPDPDIAKANKRIIMQGDIPSPLNAPSGCPFRTRCPKATAMCAGTLPKLEELKPGHFVACYYPNVNDVKEKVIKNESIKKEDKVKEIEPKETTVVEKKVENRIEVKETKVVEKKVSKKEVQKITKNKKVSKPTKEVFKPNKEKINVKVKTADKKEKVKTSKVAVIKKPNKKIEINSKKVVNKKAKKK